MNFDTDNDVINNTVQMFCWSLQITVGGGGDGGFKEIKPTTASTHATRSLRNIHRKHILLASYMILQFQTGQYSCIGLHKGYRLLL
jgi:hypothetical protein